ncbi:MAG: efflux RND transporter permease subunit [Planctomycetia bacterium]|nr:efflux RND transporter permease subunit [Planctomycetia bacterium]
MLAKFFIDRPVFAVVISLVIVFAGGAALMTLPIAQYPEIAPPTVSVSAVYPGANAKVVQETVAAPIEQEVNGVENMLYMSSQSTNDGGYNLTVTFKLGTNLDMAQVLVQNRVSLALPKLPDVVKTTGVSTKKKSSSILLVVNLFSDTDKVTNKAIYDQLYLSNYATIYIRDELVRLNGVGDVSFLGQQDYSMRVWLDPERLAARGMTAGDVVNALKEQNVQVAAGRIGQPPVPRGLDFQYILSTLGRLTEPEQFEQIIVKSGSAGQITRLRDVARLELGAKNQDTQCTLDGQPSVGLAIYQLPGSNAIEVADSIRHKMKELEASLPGFSSGVKYSIAYDTTPFIEQSVHEVFHALRDAIILVAIVVLLFLQDWKSMILPMIDVPVSLIGTLAVMAALGFTLNNLTLFGLVLAIGIVVDDAIVVLENIEVWLAKGQDARTATINAMNEITGPIIAITLVLSSVFLPSAFLGGISGQFYRQFALTISASMIISAINAMTMTPARAVQIFATRKHGDPLEALPWWGYAALLGWLCEHFLWPLVGTKLDDSSPVVQWAVALGLALPGAVVGTLIAKKANAALSVFFKWFNRGFDWITKIYGRIVAGSLRVCVIVLLIYGGLLGGTYFGLTHTPIGFIPNQDKGYLLVNVQLPDSASLERTAEVMKRVEKIARETDGVAHTIGIAGQSFVLNAVNSNFGSMFVILDEFGHRHGIEKYSATIGQKIRTKCFEEILEAQVAVFGAPPVDGLGSAGGFKLMVEDLSGGALGDLQAQADNLAAKANEQPGLIGLFNSFRANTPQLYIDVDRTKCKSMGVPLNDVFTALSVYLGGNYVNDFNQFGRTWQVNLQADSKFRIRPDDVKGLKVRNARGDMVPLGTLVEIKEIGGPVMITRYNTRTSATINGASLPGVSSGQAIQLVEAVAKAELSSDLKFEWTELTYLQLAEGSAAIFAFIGAIILVFQVLAAQYESWSMPMAVLLVVPMCLLSAIAGLWMWKLDINIFVQVGFIVLVGLAAKNAILIVETARHLKSTGESRFDAAVNASKNRLRPIIMTSFAFILGVVPLVVSHGAGFEMRRTLGVAVFFGMLGVTGFGIFLTPVFFYIIDWLSDRGKRDSE